MKLIDAYALTRTMYLKSFETDDGRQRWDSGLWIRYKIFEEARDEQPTVDAVPVIRCKDCKYGQKRTAPYMYCDIFGAVTETEWFCSRAERKEE